jgi:hypothetical protein
MHEESLTDDNNVERLTKRLNLVDKKTTKIVFKAEKNNASKKYKTDWSVALHQQSLMCRYWSVIMRGMMNGLRTNRQTTKLYNEMSKENQQYLDEIIKDTSTFQLNKISTQELKKNKDRKRELVKHHEELRIRGMSQLAKSQKLKPTKRTGKKYKMY